MRADDGSLTSDREALATARPVVDAVVATPETAGLGESTGGVWAAACKWAPIAWCESSRLISRRELLAAEWAVPVRSPVGVSAEQALGPPSG
jgi:hypothetical protein